MEAMGITGMPRALIAVAALGLALAAMPSARLNAQEAPVVATPVPTLTPAPTPVAAPTPQTFSCSCSSPGQPVVWMGRLSASSYVLAEQAARGQCLGYLNTQPGSPFVQPPSSSFLAQTQALPGPKRCQTCACN
jgi:hypothetical protein